MGISVGVIGLGAMGLGMAGHLVNRGMRVSGFDLSEPRRAAAAQAGVSIAAGSDPLIAACDAVVISLPRAADVVAVLHDGDLAVAGRTRHLIVVDTSTSEPDVSRRLAARLGEAGHGFLDAPVSGGPAGAAEGRLSMMIGGAAADLEAARPVIDVLAAKVLHVGASGAGNVAKLVNNLLVATHMLSVREAMRLAQGAGADVQAIFAAVNTATGRSAISEVHYPTWVLSGRFDSGFSAGLMRKDVTLALSLAGGTGVPLPLAARVAELWSTASSGLADSDDFTRIATA